MNSTTDISHIAQVVDDFITPAFQNEIQKVIESLPWYWVETVALFPADRYRDAGAEFEDPRVSDAFAFTHVCYSEGRPQSQYYEFFRSILRFLEAKLGIEVAEIIRIRLRLTPQYPGHKEGMFNAPHVDIGTTNSFKTLVYYVNDSDGDTFIFNRRYDSSNPPVILNKNEPDLQAIFTNTPRKGSGVYFDGRYYHAGNSPINYKSRCIINFDFVIKE